MIANGTFLQINVKSAPFLICTLSVIVVIVVVDVGTTEELRSELSLLHQGTVVVVQEFLAATKKEQSLKW